MDDVLIAFESLPWETSAPGARQKAVVRAGTRVRLLELSGEFVEHEWCQQGHVGYVLEGDLELNVADVPRRLTVGDAFVLRGDCPGDRHKARAISERVLLFLAERIAVP